MRVIVVLVILALALIATGLSRQAKDSTFDARFDSADERIRSMAADIDEDIGKSPEDQ